MRSRRGMMFDHFRNWKNFQRWRFELQVGVRYSNRWYEITSDDSYWKSWYGLSNGTKIISQLDPFLLWKIGIKVRVIRFYIFKWSAIAMKSFQSPHSSDKVVWTYVWIPLYSNAIFQTAACFWLLLWPCRHRIMLIGYVVSGAVLCVCVGGVYYVGDQ